MLSRLYYTPNLAPARNLAMEEALLLEAAPMPQLFLWQNAHTVVIGRGQNAWKECRGALLEEEGGTLVRRTTGGGAVYHDLGNLNFSFVVPKALYDVPRQLNVIRRAVAAFGIHTEASGRNDIVLSGTGEKFSGNAFRLTQQAALHHGTLLVDVDMSRLGRYLVPSVEKLRSKGVESVRSRVANLKALAPQINIPSLIEALYCAFQEAYGPAEHRRFEDMPSFDQIDVLECKYRDWNWTYGRSPKGDLSLSRRFDWGQLDLHLSLKQGRVEEALCFSDANDPELAPRIARLLTGLPFSPDALHAALSAQPDPQDRDIAQWLSETHFS